MDDQLKKQAFQRADIGYWEVDLVNGELYWSKKVYRLHELPLDCQIDLESSLAFYEEGNHRDRVQKVVNKAIEAGKSFTHESKIITAEGNSRWVRAIGETVTKNGQCIFVYGTTQNITDRKTIEQQLQRERDRLNEAQKIGEIGDWFFDVKTKERTWSPNMYNILDRNPEKALLPTRNCSLFLILRAQICPIKYSKLSMRAAPTILMPDSPQSQVIPNMYLLRESLKWIPVERYDRYTVLSRTSPSVNKKNNASSKV